jgi:fatty-acyl-CoA synthase
MVGVLIAASERVMISSHVGPTAIDSATTGQLFGDGSAERWASPPFSFHGSAAPSEGVTASGFDAQCWAWAALLREYPDQVVPVFGHMQVSMMAAWVGALRAGKLPAFLSYPNHKISIEDYRQKLQNYIDRLGSRWFVGLPGDPVPPERLLTPADLSRTRSRGDATQPPRRSEDDPLFLQCSSGSTGMQKVIAITARQLVAQLDGYRRAIDLDPSRDRIVSWLPLYHDMGLIAGFLLPLLTATPLVLLDTFEWAANPALLLRAIEAERATLCWLPNFAFQLLARIDAPHDLRSMRAFVNCSEPVSRRAFRAFCARHGVAPRQLAVSYGLAENVFAVSQTPIGRPPRVLLVDRAKYQRGQIEVRGVTDALDEPGEPAAGAAYEIVSCGPVIPGVQTCLEADAGRDIGEILIRGPATVPGYFAGPREQDADGWFPTGDLGFVHDGELHICGRKKDTIIHRGKHVFPQDVEEIAGADPDVHGGRVVAIGWHDPDAGSEAVFVLFEPPDFLGLDARAKVRARLKRRIGELLDVDASVIAVPRRWLRKTSSGKIARRANLEQYRACQARVVHVWGDSHAWIFSGRRSFRSTWIGPHVGDTIGAMSESLEASLAQIDPRDVCLLQGGEPECRSVLPIAPDPAAHIRQSVARYRDVLGTLRRAWPGVLGFLSDIPTQSETFDHGDPLWPIRGTGEARYRYQKMFYDEIAAMCRDIGVLFLDACTPLLGPDGTMDNTVRADAIHLDPRHVDVYVRVLEDALGPVDWEPSPTAAVVWDGTRPGFEQVVKDLIRQVAPDRGEPDYEHLVSGGALTSLDIFALTVGLRDRLGVEIPPSAVRRDRFESLDAIFEHFVRPRVRGRPGP